MHWVHSVQRAALRGFCRPVAVGLRQAALHPRTQRGAMCCGSRQPRGPHACGAKSFLNCHD
eukprot:365187-Chlamydomonas_euryale.AAC.15